MHTEIISISDKIVPSIYSCFEHWETIRLSLIKIPRLSLSCGLVLTPLTIWMTTRVSLPGRLEGRWTQSAKRGLISP